MALHYDEISVYPTKQEKKKIKALGHDWMHNYLIAEFQAIVAQATFTIPKDDLALIKKLTQRKEIIFPSADIVSSNDGYIRSEEDIDPGMYSVLSESTITILLKMLRTLTSSTYPAISEQAHSYLLSFSDDCEYTCTKLLTHTIEYDGARFTYRNYAPVVKLVKRLDNFNVTLLKYLNYFNELNLEYDVAESIDELVDKFKTQNS